MTEDEQFHYDFTLEEVQCLIRFFRSHESTLNPKLEKFMGSIESFIYNNMTIDEAEKFF